MPKLKGSFGLLLLRVMLIFLLLLGIELSAIGV